MSVDDVTEPRRVERKPLEWSRLTLAEWQTSSQRVEWMQALMRDPMFREWLGMLHQESTMRKGNVPMEQVAVSVEFGRAEGRADVLEMIEASGQTKDTVAEIPMTYGPVDDGDLT